MDEDWRVCVLVEGEGASLPGGTILVDEATEVGVCRAVAEQTGLTISVLHPLGTWEEAVTLPSGKVVDKVGTYFVCCAEVLVLPRPTVQFWRSVRAIPAFAEAASQHVVRKALASC